MGHGVGSLSKVKIKNILCSLLIHKDSHFAAEGYQVDRLWFSLCKSILTLLNHFLVLHVFGNDFKEDLSDHLPRNQCEAGKSVVPWIFFLALLEDRVTFSFFQSSESNPNCHDLSKIIFAVTLQ